MKEKFFLFCVMLSVFAVSCEYGITRPASNGLLLTYFSAQMIPWIWLATVPLNLLVVMLYNRYLGKIGPVKMLGIVALLTILINATAGIVTPYFPSWILFQFVWKDIYVLLMFKQVWSLIHSSSIAAKAKIFYGVIYAMGTVGAICGSLVSGFFAVEIGSQQLLFFTLPIYLVFFLGYRKAVQLQQASNLCAPLEEIRETTRASEGFGIIRRSPFLISVLCLVLLMQSSVGLMEFQFNSYLEHHITELDLRTQYMGRMLSLMNVGSGLLQLVGAGAMVHLLGVRGSHMALPLMLLMSAVGLMIAPSFALISFSFVFTKAIDFSLFGILREMLYIPLKTEEKFQAKAVIDVFVHRSAKAVVSIGILALNFFAGKELLSWVSPAAAGVFVLWLAVVWFSLRRYLPQSYPTKI
jgi:AAA family ATP:ADP antiporter